MLKLYDCSTAPSPRRARMFLAEKGLEWETVEIDLRTGEHLGEAYRKVHPGGMVPALEHDGHVITENLAIAAYVEALHPEPALLGSTALEKARVAEWNARCEMGGLMAIAEALRNSSPHMKDRALPGPRPVPQIPELAERGRMRLAWWFKAMERRLADNDYMAGDFYSLADITATVTFDFSKWIKEQPGDDHPHCQAYMARMRERTSYSL